MLPADAADRVHRSRRRTMRLFAGTLLSGLAASGLSAAGSGTDGPSPAWSVAAAMVVLSFFGNGIGTVVSAFHTRRLRRRALIASAPPMPGSAAAALPGAGAPRMPEWPAEDATRRGRAERDGPWVGMKLRIAALLALGWFVAWGLVVQTGIDSHQRRLLAEGAHTLASVEWVSSSSEGFPIGADAGRIGVAFWDGDVRIHATIHLRDVSPVYRVGQPLEVWYDPSAPAAWVVTPREPNRPPLATALGYLAILALVFAVVVGLVQLVKLVGWFARTARGIPERG
ncbi:MAG: hypothetical protein ACXVQJ_02955 [Actinomycetota bacterium]